MEKIDVYLELARKLSMENSPTIPRIWRILCSEDEAEIINAMPGTAEDLAVKFGKNVEEMKSLLERLFQRGVVFDNTRNGKTTYRMPRHIIQFHDATVLWPDVPSEVLELWSKFHEEEFHQIPEMLTQFKLPSMMRVLPINESIEAKSEVMIYEDAVRMVESAANLAVTKCTCRMIEKKCTRPLEVCLQLDKGADYAIRRGTGRKITVEEAKEILKKSEAAGLVHTTENRAVVGTTLCNCCDCCCITLPYMKNEATKGVLAPSRFEARIDESICMGCGLCMEICPVAAIVQTERNTSAVEGTICIGCGLCARECPSTAIILRQVREKDFTPA